MCPKLQTPYTGPFLLQKKLSEHKYVILMSKSKSDVKAIHHMLKPCTGNLVRKWANVLETRE